LASSANEIIVLNYTRPILYLSRVCGHCRWVCFSLICVSYIRVLHKPVGIQFVNKNNEYDMKRLVGFMWLEL